MNKDIQIGAGNKYIYLAVLIFHFSIALFFLIYLFNNSDAIYLFVAAGFSFIYHFVHSSRLNFIYYSEGFFTIENVLRKNQKESIRNYKNAYEGNFSFLVLNSTLVEFKYGKTYKIMGGTERTYEIDSKIKQLKYSWERSLAPNLHK